LIKKIISLLFVIILLSACGDGTGQKKINLAVIGEEATSYWNNVKMGSEAAAKDLGISVKFFAPTEKDPAWQIREIEKLIDKPIDGIAFAASDAKSITPSILKAMQSGIPCVAMDTDVSKSRNFYIGTRDHYIGKRAGEEMASLLDNKGRIAIVADASTNPDSLERMRGFRDTLAEYADIEIIWQLEENPIQVTDVEARLKASTDLNGIFCASNSAGIAVAEAVDKINKMEEIKIICVGESSEVMKLIRDKAIQAAVARRPYRMGYLSVLVLCNMAKVGVDNALLILPKSEMIDTGIVIVTPANVVQYSEHLESLGIKLDF
jgi:ribose transport system substrate-binding protein